MFIVVYDFEGEVSPKSFFYRLNKLMESGNFHGHRIQYSVFLCHDRKSAEELADLVRMFDGRVRVFRVAQEV